MENWSSKREASIPDDDDENNNVHIAESSAC